MAAHIGWWLVKGMLGLLLAGLALGVGMPWLHGNGVEAPEWIVWPVVMGILALLLWPDISAWRRARRERARL